MPTDAVTVRPAVAADLPAVAALYAHHVLHGTGSFELTPPDLAEMTTRFDAVRARGNPWLVAEAGGEVVGYAYAGPFRPRPAFDATVEDAIYVRHDRGGRGVGSALLAELVDRCTALGYRQMVALIGDSANTGSIGVHRKAGFREAGRFTSVGWKSDRWLDVVFMQRPLGIGDDHPAQNVPRVR